MFKPSIGRTNWARRSVTLSADAVPMRHRVLVHHDEPASIRLMDREYQVFLISLLIPCVTGCRTHPGTISEILSRSIRGVPVT